MRSLLAVFLACAAVKNVAAQVTVRPGDRVRVRFAEPSDSVLIGRLGRILPDSVTVGGLKVDQRQIKGLDASAGMRTYAIKGALYAGGIVGSVGIVLVALGTRGTEVEGHVPTIVLGGLSLGVFAGLAGLVVGSWVERERWVPAVLVTESAAGLGVAVRF